jgi:hypothetical protein
MVVDDDGLCVASTTHLNSIYLPCDNDDDCLGADGVTEEKCRCGLLGEAYCSLHTRDEPYMEYKTALINKNYFLVAYYNQLIQNWP